MFCQCEAMTASFYWPGRGAPVSLFGCATVLTYDEALKPAPRYEPLILQMSEAKAHTATPENTLSAAENLMLINFPFLKEVYTYGIRNDSGRALVHLKSFRNFIINNMLFDKEFVDYLSTSEFKDIVNETPSMIMRHLREHFS